MHDLNLKQIFTIIDTATTPHTSKVGVSWVGVGVGSENIHRRDFLERATTAVVGILLIVSHSYSYMSASVAGGPIQYDDIVSRVTIEVEVVGPNLTMDSFSFQSTGRKRESYGDLPTRLSESSVDCCFVPLDCVDGLSDGCRRRLDHPTSLRHG